MVGESKGNTGKKEKMNNSRACGLYVRVSTDRQAIEGESLEEQEQRLRDFLQTEKLECSEGIL
jgi:hypothetical protein